MNPRGMFFVDGSNFLVQMGKSLGQEINPHKPRPIELDWAGQFINILVKRSGTTPIRVTWYGSYQGSEEDYDAYRDRILKGGYSPILFKKISRDEKGVDIALTKDMLVHAFNRNFDHGYLIAGDGDYVQLLDEAKRYGGRIFVAFWTEGLSPELRRTADVCEIFNDFLGSDRIKKCMDALSKAKR